MSVVLLEKATVTRFIPDTVWCKTTRNPGPRTGNRVLTMRMRDSRRWLNRYREQAMDLATEEAKRAPLKSFLQSVMYVLTYASETSRRLP